MRSLKSATRWELRHGLVWMYYVLRVTCASWTDCETRHGWRWTSVDFAFVWTEAWPFLVVERVSVNSLLCYLPIAWQPAFLNSPVLLLLHYRTEAYLWRSRLVFNSAAWLSSWCCQTNEPKHQYLVGGYFYEVTKERHSVRAVSRIIVNVMRYGTDRRTLDKLETRWFFSNCRVHSRSIKCLQN